MIGLVGLAAGCAAPPPETEADAADAAACTAQADAVYNNQNVDALSRTSQTGLYFAPTPNHVFDGQRLGDLHQRDSAITSCESHGNDIAGPGHGAALPTPQIINPP